MTYRSALIVGAGSGLSASLAHSFAKAGMTVALAARSPQKLAEFATATAARTYNCDAAKRDEVEALFAQLDAEGNAPDVVVYNPSYRVRGPLIDLDPAEVEKTIAISAFGGFLVAQAAVKRMLPRKEGALLFTGASASVKGYAQSAAFAMASSRCAASRKVWRANWPRKASTSRILLLTAASAARAARPRPTNPTRCSIRTRLRNRTCRCCNNRVMRGRRKSSCGPGSRSSRSRVYRRRRHPASN